MWLSRSGSHRREGRAYHGAVLTQGPGRGGQVDRCDPTTSPSNSTTGRSSTKRSCASNIRQSAPETSSASDATSSGWFSRAVSLHLDDRVIVDGRRTASDLSAVPVGVCVELAGMRTSVRMYVISDPAHPHVVLDISGSLEAVAAALASRPESGLAVYVNRDGLSHELDAAEQRELNDLLHAARSLASDDGSVQ